LTTYQIWSLRTAQLLSLQSSQISALRTDQLGALSTTRMALLLTTQILALNSDQIANLSTLALRGLSTASIAAMESEDIAAMGTAQIAALRSVQWNALSTVQIAGLSSDGLNALSTTTLRALGTSLIAGLTSDCVAMISTTSLLALSTTQIAALASNAVASLGTSSLRALSTRQLLALLTEQIVGLTSDQAASLSTVQIRALSTDQIAALETEDLAAISTAGIRIMSTSQTDALSDTQISALTSAQTAALTTTQESILGLSTPIMLDLNGDGIHTLSHAAGVQFDLLATGSAVRTGWVGNGDGLLAWDRNHDGSINDGSELFGSSTQLADGSRALDGYQALRALDSNADGVISAADRGFSELSVWIDANANASTEAGELRGLKDLNISEISLTVTDAAIDNNGNVIGLESQFTTGDGQVHAAADVWLAYSADSSVGAGLPALDARASLLGQSIGTYQDSSATPYAPIPSLASSGAGASGATGLLAPGALADSIRHFTASTMLSAPAQNPAAAAMQASATVPLVSDPLQNKTAADGVLAAPFKT
jgi:hypothetical protein